MSINETVTFNVDPERGYGPYNPANVVHVPRYYNKSMFEVVPRSYLEAQGVNATQGTGFETAYGTVFVNDTNEENVTLFYILTPGTEFTFNGIPQQVVTNVNYTAVIEYMLKENASYVLPHPGTGAPTNYRVTGKTDQNITLDGNHPFANDTLRFEVTLLDAEPA
jgi:FKBP-type peptidyl-prolyl cis-trans isomerase 2